MQTEISYASTTLSHFYRWSSAIFLPKIHSPPSSIIPSIEQENKGPQYCRLARIMGFNNGFDDVHPAVSNITTQYPRETQTTWHTTPKTDKIPPHSPFLQCRIDRTIPDGAYIRTTTPVLRDVAVARPSNLETKAPRLYIHSPIPMRPFKTAEFLLGERAATPEEGHWNVVVPDSAPLLDRQITTSQAIAYVPMYPLPTHQPIPITSPVTPPLPSWPSSALSLSIPPFDIYPTTPSPLDPVSNSHGPHHSRLFEYLSLSAPLPLDSFTKNDPINWKSYSFDHDWDSHWTEVSSCASTCSSGSLYPMSSASDSDMDLGTNYSPEPQYDCGSPSPSSSLSFSISATSTRCLSAQSQVARVNVNEENAGSFIVLDLASDERMEGTGLAEWKGEKGRLSEKMCKGRHAMGFCEKLLGLGRLGRRTGEFLAHAGDAR